MKIGASTLFKPADQVGAVRDLIEMGLGIKDIELSIPLEVPWGELRELKALKREHGLNYSVHAPFIYDDLAHPHPKIREVYKSQAKEAIDFAHELGSTLVVVHPGHMVLEYLLPDEEAFMALRLPKERYLENSIHSLKELAAYAKSKGVNLSVENLQGIGRDHGDIGKLLDEVQGLSLTLDVGHANLTRNLRMYLESFSGRIISLHLHDNDGARDLHWPLGKGEIDFHWLMSNLHDPDRRLILELYSEDDLRRSFAYLKTITDRIMKEESL